MAAPLNINVTGTGTITSPSFSGNATLAGTMQVTFDGATDDVTNLLAQNNGATQIDLSWTPPAGAIGYAVEYRVYNAVGSATWSNPVSVSGSTYSVTGLSAGVLYEFRVKANFGPAGTSGGVTTVKATPDTPVTIAAPTNVRLSAVTTTTADIAWNSVAGATMYKLYLRLTNGGAFGASPNAVVSATGYTFVGLTSNTAYTVRVIASTGTIDGPSTDLAISTPSGSIGDPSGLTATMSNTSASLSWTAGAGAASYLVDYQVTGTSYGVASEVTATAASITGLSPGVGYTFRVRSKSGTTLSSGVTTTGTTTGTSGGGSSTADAFSGGSGTGSSLSVTKPAATNGQRYLLAVNRKSKGTSATTPSGFSVLQTVTNSTGPGETILYEKVSAGETAGTISLSFGASVDAAWVLLLTSKARTVTPTVTQAGFAEAFITPDITATAAASTLVHFVCSSQWPRTFGLPSGMAAQGGSPFSAVNGPSILAASATVGIGGTGTFSYTPLDGGVLSGDDYQAISVVLDGASGSTGTGDSGNAVNSQIVTTTAGNSGDTRFFAMAFKDATTRSISTPSGWTQVNTVATAVGRLTVFSQVLTTAVAAGTVTVSFTGGTANCAVVAWTMNAVGTIGTSAISSGASSTTATAPSVTANTANSTLVQIVASAQYPRTFTQPAGFTAIGQQQEVVSGPSLAVSYKTVASGPTGTNAWTMNTSDDWLAISVPIDAASSGGGSGGGSGSGSIFFLGSHQHGYANNADRHAAGTYPSSINTMEAFNFGVIRTHDCETTNTGPWWTNRSGGINGAGPNVYSWAVLDAWTDKVVGRGHKILLCFSMNPAWASRNPGGPSPYGAGTVSWVPNPTAWREYVRDTLSHIIARHGAANVIAVEVWNEALGGDNLTSGQFMDATNYGSGVADKMARMYADIAKYTFLGVRDVSSTMPVLLGAHTYQNDTDTRRLMGARTSANEAITSFGTAWSFHPYGLYDGNGLSPSLTSITSSMRALATEYGTASWDFWATEVGLYYPWDATRAAWWNGLSATQRATHIQAWCALYRTLGYKGLITYSVDGAPNPGDLSFLGDPEHVSQTRDALNAAYAALNKEA